MELGLPRFGMLYKSAPLSYLKLIIAYFLLSTNRMSSQSLNYQLLNFIGASLILFSLLFHFNLASFVIEVIWIIISLIGIYRITLKQ